MFTLSYKVRSLSISQYFYIDNAKGVDCAFNGFPFLPTVQKFTYHMWFSYFQAKSAVINRVPTSSGNHGKPGKSLKKFHAWKNHGI